MIMKVLFNMTIRKKQLKLLIFFLYACTHPPSPLLLQAKEGGEKPFSPSLRSREGLG